MASNRKFLLLLLRINVIFPLLLVMCSLSAVRCGKIFANDEKTEQKFAMEPQDQTAIVGSRVTLPCRVISKMGMLQWTKDDFGLGTHRNLSGFERYAMVGSDEEGDFSLDIYPVMLDDDAKYQCQVGPGPLGQPGIRSRFATLSVLVPPEPPKIVQGEFLVTTEDREIELECISIGGKPAAEITWIDGLGNVMTEGLEYIVDPLQDGRRFTAKSILKLTPKKDHHNTTFTCQAQNTADRTYRAAKLKLEVKYAPKVSVSVIGGSLANGRIPEGSEVRLACRADANPDDLSYKWFINDEPVIGDYTTEMVIHNVTRKYHDAIVKCEVHNAVGKSEESETLDISYGPRFKTRPRSVQADMGTTVSLSCDVDGNPPADVVWIHEDTERVVGSSPNLTLTVDDNTSGRYYCKASVMGFQEIGAEASIYLKGPPTIISHHTQFGIQGDNVRIECVAFSIPKPEHVIWTYNGQEINTSNNQDYSILEDPLPDGIKSTLIVRESQMKHFGLYNCSVGNDYGTDVVEINLLPQKSFPLLMIITGVVAGVVLIIAVTMVIILCQKRGKHKKSPNDNNTIEKQCKDSDRSSNISDLKLELRGGSCELDYSNHEYSETGSDSVVTRIGVPLAGPVAMPGDHLYRYSADYTEPNFPPKSNDGQNNNGYVPYVDYSRDYNPPSLSLKPALQATLESSRESLQSARVHLNSLHSNNALNVLSSNHQLANIQTNNGIGHNSLSRHPELNGYILNSNSLQRNIDLRQENGLPILTNNHPLADVMAVSQTAADGRLPNGLLPQNALILQNSGFIPNGILPQNNQLTQNGIDPRYSATYGNPYLRNSNASLPPPSTANPSATPAPPPYTSANRNASNQSSAAPQVARLPNSPTSQYIVPNAQVINVKKGTLATHV